MISLFGATFSVISPFILAAAAVAGLAALIYAYLRKGRGNKRPVATLFLLRLIESVPRMRQKLLPPWRFFFEFLVVLLLSLAAAGIYREDDEGRVVYLIDNSFSMSASSGMVSDARSTMAIARERALKSINALPSHAVVDVFVTSPVLTSLTGEMVSKEIGTLSIGKIEAVYASDNIEGALQKLRSTYAHEKLKIFSDRAGQLSNDKSDQVRGGKPVEIELIRLPSGGSLDNITISSIALSDAGIGDSGRSVEVGLDSFSREAVQATLLLEGLPNDSRSLRYSKIAERELTLQSQKRIRESFKELSADFTAFKATVNVKRKAGASDFDAISGDNTAWISSESSGAETALVSDIDPRTLGLDLIKGISIDGMRPERFRELQLRGELLKYRSFIFHRFVPEELPQGNMLFVVPETQSRLFPALETHSGVSVTRWQRSHPLLSYLNLSILKLSRLSSLKVPVWGTELISTPVGAAAYAGELDRRRLVVIGFEIFPFEARRSPTLSVLTINILKWISNLSNAGNTLSTYSLIRPENDIQKIAYYGGDEIYSKGARALEEKAHELRPTLPGLLEVVHSGGKVTYQAVNYFATEESNILALRSFSFSEGESSVTEETVVEGNLVQRLLWLASLMLLLDLAVVFIWPLFRRQQLGLARRVS